MKPLILGVLIGLVACAPRPSAPFQQAALPAKLTTELLQSFDGELQSHGIQVLQATGQMTRPNTEEGLLYVVQQFKTTAKGFCPLAEGSFVADPSGKRFLTIFAQGQQVKALIYDRTDPQGILSTVLTAKMETPTSVKSCQ